MGFYRGPNIIRDGLILLLDAGNIKSYHGSGSSIKDLIDKNSYNMSSGVSVVNGVLNFDDTNNAYIELGTNFTPNIYSKMVWIKTSDINAANVISGSSGEVFYIAGGSFHLSNTWSSPDVYSACNYYDNNWHLLSGTFDGSTGKIYFDSELLNSGSLYQLGSRTTYIGMYGYTNNFNGYMGNIMIYNRALTQLEITQNFNAQKGRFGL